MDHAGGTVATTKEGQKHAAGGTGQTTKEGQQHAASGENTSTEEGRGVSEPQQEAAKEVTDADTTAKGDESVGEGVVPSPSLQPGSIVIGTSVKWKDKYDGVKCKVLQLLAKHVKVEILEGPAKGEVHKYTYDSVTRFAPPASSGSASAPAASSGSSGEPPAPALPVVAEPKEESLDVSELWGDNF